MTLASPRLLPSALGRCLGRHALEQLVESGVLRVDSLAQLGEVRVELIETTIREPARTPLAIDAPDDETRLFQQLEVA